MRRIGRFLESKKKLVSWGILGLVLGCSLVFVALGHRQPPVPPTLPLSPIPPEPTQRLRYAIFPAPPYMIGADDEQSTPTGIDVEIVQTMAHSMNLEVEYIRCAWVRCLELMETGKADILSSVYKKPERTRFMTYLDTPYLTELPIAFYYLKGRGYTVNRYQDIYQFNTIGVLRGASYFERFDRDPLAKKYNADTQDQLFPMLLKGRIDAMAGYIPTENYRLVTEGYADKVQRSAFENAEPANVYITLSKQSPVAAQLANFNKINQQLIETGIITGIVNHYYQKYQ